MFTALVVQADDDGTHDAVRDLVDTVQLSREIGLGLKTNQRVNALRLILDRVRQTALAPVLDLYLRAVRLNERLELVHNSGSRCLFQLGVNDEDSLVLARNLCHILSTSFWTFGPHPLM